MVNITWAQNATNMSRNLLRNAIESYTQIIPLDVLGPLLVSILLIAVYLGSDKNLLTTAAVTIVATITFAGLFTSAITAIFGLIVAAILAYGAKRSLA